MSALDHQWMQEAIACAQCACAENEVPVGAVIVYEDRVIAKGWNKTIQQQDPSAHAEIVAMREAGHHLQNYRLLNTTLYVTLEPCLMCLGAMIHARLSRIVFGAPDPKTGACGGALQALKFPHWNHSLSCTGGVLTAPCQSLLTEFFQTKRGFSF